MSLLHHRVGCGVVFVASRVVSIASSVAARTSFACSFTVVTTSAALSWVVLVIRCRGVLHLGADLARGRRGPPGELVAGVTHIVAAGRELVVERFRAECSEREHGETNQHSHDDLQVAMSDGPLLAYPAWEPFTHAR